METFNLLSDLKDTAIVLEVMQNFTLKCLLSKLHLEKIYIYFISRGCFISYRLNQNYCESGLNIWLPKQSLSH